MTLAPPDPQSAYERIRERRDASGIRRVHIHTFRDLDDLEAGGSEEHALQVCTHLATAGIDVTLHTGRVDGAPEEVHRNGFRVVRRGGRLGVFATSAIDEHRRLGPCDGIIEIFHGAPFFAPLWAPRTPQVAVVHHVHLGTWHMVLPGPLGRVGDAVERYALPRVYRRRLVVTAADSARDEIVAQYRMSPDQVRVVPHGIDPRFRPGDQRWPAPLVVAVARMMPQKGLSDLIDIAVDVRRAVPDVEFTIIGDGPQRAELEAKIARLDAAPFIRLVGKVDHDELVAWYQRAWVVASASHAEGFGLTLTEAAACATPVVASDMAGHRDAVAHGVGGFLAERGRPMADAIVRLLTDTDLRTRLSAGALAFSRRFRWEETACGLYDALVADASHRTRP